MIPFRERNPIPIAVVGILVLVGLLLAAFNTDKLPFLGGGTTVQADFADASGLKSNDDVRVAGVKVGSVSSVSLAGDVVRVSMNVDSGTDLGRLTSADIKIKTLLGQKYVALTPAGGGSLDKPIPLSRTTTPLDVTEAFIGLSDRVGAIDTKQLAKSFDVLSATFKDSPDNVKSALRGLSRLSTTVASRDQQLAALLAKARGVTGVLAARDAEVAKLIQDGDLILRTVEAQRATIHQLLVNTTALSEQLTALVGENRSALEPALQNLQATLAILKRNQDNLSQTVKLLAPFVRGFDNALGNGRWFDTWVANLGQQNGVGIQGVAP